MFVATVATAGSDRHSWRFLVRVVVGNFAGRARGLVGADRRVRPGVRCTSATCRSWTSRIALPTRVFLNRPDWLELLTGP